MGEIEDRNTAIAIRELAIIQVETRDDVRDLVALVERQCQRVDDNTRKLAQLDERSKTAGIFQAIGTAIGSIAAALIGISR